MPLNEREQQILEEIERQFRVEDPKFTRKTSKTSSSLSRLDQRNFRLPVAGVAVGMLLLATYWVSTVWPSVPTALTTVLALAGFGLMVLSVSALVQARRGSSQDSGGASGDFLSSAKNSRWPFRR
jgi:hypothetical protein